MMSNCPLKYTLLFVSLFILLVWMEGYIKGDIGLALLSCGKKRELPPSMGLSRQNIV